MPRVPANGIEIEYESFGDPAAPPLLLIMGLGAQMITWDEDFCAQLAARGHFVVRFDNRDVGLSTRLEDAGAPDLSQALLALSQGQPGRIAAPYTLDHMADDAAGLLDSLGIKAAHVVGASMGGMIGQTLAIRHPSRVLTLTSIMSTTGDPRVPAGRPEVMAVLFTPLSPQREAHIERAVEILRIIGSPGFPFDEERARRLAERSFERGFYPAGYARQLVAILASGSRKERLASVRTPALVIHGAADPLVPVEGGQDTAASIPGAELLIIEGMGHDLPRPVWGRIVGAISAHTALHAAHA